uniref:Uncharacterized protein n=1 Tax=Solibacter usitatus (strain Ellin6076) TaxID=234267 RepID=Q020D7_SOLUE
MIKQLQCLAAAGALSLALAVNPLAAAPDDGTNTFNMLVSAGAKTCLANATATVKIRPTGAVDIMEVTADGLPANTNFNVFVIQVPKAQFGVAWYQGDLVTDKKGRARQEFTGRFNIETFSTAQGSVPAPLVFTDGPFPDASTNPSFNPIQMYHLGIWFDSPLDAQNAGCPATVTPFGGNHQAGLQIFNTSNSPDDHGPLKDTGTSTKH